MRVFDFCVSRLVPAVLWIPLAAVSLAAQHDYVNAQLPWHKAVLDAQQRLLAWHQPEMNLGYDKVMRIAWDFIEHKVPDDTRHGAGLKIYLINATFNSETLQGRNWQHNPAGNFAQFVDAVVGWYPYSGDVEAIRVVREMLDYQLAHGTTPGDWKWAGVPFATSCGNAQEYGRCLQNMPRDYYGGIETDKVGELGVGYALFYELTGERKYLEAALRCGDALAKHVRTGDADRTPWPFRLDARTGEVLAGEEFGGMVVAPVRLFDELIRLGEGGAASFQTARDVAWKWILQHPLNRGSRAFDKWSGYFEDMPKNTENVNQALPTMTAYYILTREDPAAVDREWVAHVGHLIDWVRLKFGRGPFFGAWGIDEQGTPQLMACCSRAGLGSDSSRWAAINAMYYEKTGDGQAREDAFRSLNYSTYFAAPDGKISCCGEGYHNPNWFSDGYGDYVRNFLWALGAIPELAPVGENHLLRSTSVVQKVAYSNRTVQYRTFHTSATEVLRLNFKPVQVRAGGQACAERNDLLGEGYTVKPLPGGDYLVRVRHGNSGEISITGQ